jgi:thiamine-monophosphate kinase
VQKQVKTGRTQSKDAAGELALIRAIRSRAAKLPRGGVSLGIGDDCALIRPRPGEELAVTTDLSIESRHFRLDWHPPESVGHRALARGLSDLAAMGARPVAAFLSLGLPRELTVARKGPGAKSAWVDRFLDGLLALAATTRVPLAGGDLAESPMVVADIQLIGAVPVGKALLRSGARPGDQIYVTGSLGGSAAELTALSKTPKIFAGARSATNNHPQLYPQPRIRQGLWLRKHGLASAAIDLSDGLSTDLAHICAASGICAEVDAAALPLGKDATLAMALGGGEDYELLFTSRGKVPRSIGGVSITGIGQIVAASKGRPQITLRTERGLEPLEPRGWEHFSSK